MPDEAAPSRALRARLALLGAVVAGARAFAIASSQAKPRDFDQVWYAARALFAGRDPYAEVGPGLAFDWHEHLYYPLTAAVAAAPLAPFARPVADGLFMAIGVGAFVWAATRRSLWPALVIASASTVFATETVQWSPLLGAAAALPWFGVVLAAKPTIGFAMFAARPSREAVVGGAALALVALALLPAWPAEWLAAVRHTSTLSAHGTPYLAPVGAPGGPLVLLALLRWRRPEARLVLALACVPQTPLLYETVPLFLVPVTAAESLALWAGSWGALLWTAHAGPFASDVERFPVSRAAITWLLYLPCLAMVLRRPNTGPAPAWVESLLRRARVPARLRGAPSGA